MNNLLSLDETLLIVFIAGIILGMAGIMLIIVLTRPTKEEETEK